MIFSSPGLDEGIESGWVGDKCAAPRVIVQTEDPGSTVGREDEKVENHLQAARPGPESCKGCKEGGSDCVMCCCAVQ